MVVGYTATIVVRLGCAMITSVVAIFLIAASDSFRVAGGSAVLVL